MAFGVWITGPPASGKSTITRALTHELGKMGIKVEVLESDRLREVLTPEPRYTDPEREHFYAAVTYIGWLLIRNGINVIFDATAHREAFRENARRRIPDLITVYVTCSFETRRKRDSKGLYEAAEQGRIKSLPGLQVPFEEPRNPDVIIDSERVTAAEAAQLVLEAIDAKIGLKQLQAT